MLIEYEDRDGLTASVIIEIKNTVWDQVRPHRVGPNLGRHRRQVWGYLEPLILRADAREVAFPQAFIVYPRRPERADLAGEIETYLTDGYGIVVTYADELLLRA